MDSIASFDLPEPGRCLVMGIVNVTPDSFSDGGLFLADQAAAARARHLWTLGADIVDIGGESTRPGAVRVNPEEELKRVIPVFHALREEKLFLSVDTLNASVAFAACEAGARMINDVSAGLADPNMASVVSEAGVPWVLGHSRRYSSKAADVNETVYPDVVRQVRDELSARVDAALAAGVSAQAIILDPGLGFSKGAHDNWQLLHNLELLTSLGFPVLIGASRKRFLGDLLSTVEDQRAPAGRDVASAATSALAAANGAWGVRVHDVRASLDAVKVAKAWSVAGLPDSKAL